MSEEFVFKIGDIEEPKPNGVAKLFEDNNSNNPNDKIVCVQCTKQFFEIFFVDRSKQEVDPVMADILNQKIYMKAIPEQGCYKCPSCGQVELMRDLQVNEPERKLRVKGMDAYPEYKKYTGSSGNFTGGTNVKHESREDILF